MKALTLDQPFASAIALGLKTIETRSWWTGHRGPLAIHAASVARLAYKPTFYHCAPEHRATFIAAGYRDFWELPLGVVVAIADIVACEPVETVDISDQERHWGDYRPGRYAWRLANVHSLVRPIAIRGHQRIWDWNPPTDLQLVPAGVETALAQS